MDEDYNSLLAAGRQYIEELGSALWTDYNEHDPGITILEELCYAITELGFRTSLPMKDLLTQQDGTIPSSQTFFTAKEILTQSPLNKNDYRKLLIDIDGIQNAWLFAKSHYKSGKEIVPAGEVPIYADFKKDILTYTEIPKSPVYLRGLYKVLLDLDDDLQLGDLNTGEIDVKAGATQLIISFPAWDEMMTTYPELFTIDVNNPAAFPAIIFPPAFDDTGLLTISFPFDNTTHAISGQISVGLQPAGVTLTNADIGAFFTNSQILTQQVLNLYLSKIIKANSIVKSAKKLLNCHRNLCEDFVSVDTIKDEPIAFCFDIDITPDADMEEVAANIFYTIEQYLDPGVNFYLLSEMLQKTNPVTTNKYTVDEIFDGPKLQHGFIDTTELENTELVTEIYASEIISRIMNIQINDENVVLAVRNFRMTAYDDSGTIITTEANQRWCIQVADWHKPVLANDKSKITIYKNDIPFLPKQKETDQTLEWMESMNAREKLVSIQSDIPIPYGTYFPLDTYTSIQSLFPKTYAVGDSVLPSTATDERKSQARQLKAYLLFYDQLLADFFMQLKNAKELFSTDAIRQTYFAQFVNGFYDFESVYVRDASNNYVLKENVFNNQDATLASPAPPNGWENLYESNETFIDRRNRFLDHLMARFAESFNEYVFLMYSLDNVTQEETQIDPADLIQSKMEFLSNYPTFSYNRARAFDYCPLDQNFNIISSKLWDTDNVSGLEEKLCLLGGFKDPSSTKRSFFKRYLRCLGSGDIDISVLPVEAGTDTQYYFIVSQGPLNLTSGNFASLALLYADLVQLITNISAPGFTYNNIPDSSGNGNIIQLSVNGNTIQSNSFDNSNDAGISMTNLIKDFNIGNACSNEGLYFIEHILLRPRNTDYVLAPVCLDKDCDTCCNDDPYSFRISIILPYWVSHFNNMDFRTYFEKLAREEAPAHCMVKVCWINQDAMLQFEIAYKTWLQAMAAYYSNESVSNNAFLTDATNNLINILYSLHSEYPVATLHDCEESAGTNPVMLGKTVLGTINK